MSGLLLHVDREIDRSNRSISVFFISHARIPCFQRLINFLRCNRQIGDAYAARIRHRISHRRRRRRIRHFTDGQTIIRSRSAGTFSATWVFSGGMSVMLGILNSPKFARCDFAAVVEKHFFGERVAQTEHHAAFDLALVH